jgi:hypothetical protein
MKENVVNWITCRGKYTSPSFALSSPCGEETER